MTNEQSFADDFAAIQLKDDDYWKKKVLSEYQSKFHRSGVVEARLAGDEWKMWHSVYGLGKHKQSTQ